MNKTTEDNGKIPDKTFIKEDNDKKGVGEIYKTTLPRSPKPPPKPLQWQWPSQTPLTPPLATVTTQKCKKHSKMKKTAQNGKKCKKMAKNEKLQKITLIRGHPLWYPVAKKFMKPHQKIKKYGQKRPKISETA